jgi:predicted Fe-Mo cluster-binding NifX family protein
MKLAVMLYGTRVSPRFGYSQGMLIVEVSGKSEIGRKNLKVGNYYPDQIPEILGKEGVEVVISGGMNHHFQNLFRLQGIEVIWGIIGEADDVLAAFTADQLTTGMGSCPRGRKQRRMRGQG